MFFTLSNILRVVVCWSLFMMQCSFIGNYQMFFVFLCFEIMFYLVQLYTLMSHQLMSSEMHSPLCLPAEKTTSPVHILHASVAETQAFLSKSESGSLCALLTRPVLHSCQHRACSCSIVHTFSQIQDSLFP